jgi:hypothetical protein
MRPHSGATASARSAQETSVEKIISKSQMLGGQLFQNRPLAADLVVVHRIIMVDCSVYTRCRVGVHRISYDPIPWGGHLG